VFPRHIIVFGLLVIIALFLATGTVQARPRSCSWSIQQHVLHGEMVPTVMTVSLTNSSGESPMEE
jgi:hypothetical protein